MSHWDFGRRPDAERDLPATGLSDTAYQPDPVLEAEGAWAAHDARPAYEAGPGDDGWASGDGVTGENPWPARPAWPAADRPPRADDSPGESWPSGDSWDDEDEDDEATALYPLTYERDDFPEADPEPAPPPAAPWEPWPPAPRPEVPGTPGPGGADGHAGSWDAGAAGEPRSDGWQAGFAGPGRPDQDAAGPGWADPGPGLPWEDPADFGGGARRAGRGGLRWPVVAGVVAAGAAVGAAAVLLAGRAPAGRGGQVAGSPPATPPATPAARAGASTPQSAAAAAPLTLTQAEAVVAGYTTANNNANAQRSSTLLAAIETGSSYAIDAGLYQMQQGTAPYPAFGPAQATYYIPGGEPDGGPRWFVVQVANAFDSNPKKITSTEYLLFTQSAPGGPWQDAAEPYLLSGASAPRIAVGADGLADAVSPDAASVAVQPAELAAATAAAADGTAAGAGQAAITAPGNLADVGDQKFWQGKLPDGTVTDTHTPATGTAGEEFALQTADGGALVFYADAAQLTITPPAGVPLSLAVPGFYSPDQALSQAGLTYLEQFAAYDPPAGGAAPTVIADYSGITGKD
jgi:hypothetical protein